MNHERNYSALGNGEDTKRTTVTGLILVNSLNYRKIERAKLFPYIFNVCYVKGIKPTAHVGHHGLTRPWLLNTMLSDNVCTYVNLKWPCQINRSIYNIWQHWDTQNRKVKLVHYSLLKIMQLVMKSALQLSWFDTLPCIVLNRQG